MKPSAFLFALAILALPAFPQAISTPGASTQIPNAPLAWGYAAVGSPGYTASTVTASLAVVMPQAASSTGNLYVGCFVVGYGTFSISDGHNTWTTIQSIAMYSNTFTVIQAYAYVSYTGAAPTVTVSAGSSAASSGNIQEYSGLATSSVVDKSAQNESQSQPVTSSGNTATTTQAAEMISGCGAYYAQYPNPGTGFTPRAATQTTGTVATMLEDMAVASTGAYAATFCPSTGCSGGLAGTAQVTTFKFALPDFSLSGATAGYYLAVSSNITVTKQTGNWSSCTVTVSDGAQGGIWGGSMSGTSTGTFLANGISTFNATYEPVVTGAIAFTWSSSCGSNPPVPTTYTSNLWTVAITGCTSGVLFVASGTCTATLTGGTFNGAIALTEKDYSNNPTGGNGSTFVVNTVSTLNTFSITPASGSTVTFTINPVVVGTIDLTTAFNVAYIATPTPTGYAVTSADSCQFAAKANGNWNAAGTWTVSSCTGGGHTTPHSGDGPVTVTGYHVACSTGICYAGTNPANNTTFDVVIANNGSTASGELEVLSGATLWLTGNYELASNAGASPTTFAILKVDTGGTFIQDQGNSSVVFRGVPAATSNWIMPGDIGPVPIELFDSVAP